MMQNNVPKSLKGKVERLKVKKKKRKKEKKRKS